MSLLTMPAPGIQLRPYQQAAVTGALKAIAGGKKAPLVVSPTGTGKMEQKYGMLPVSKCPGGAETPRGAAPYRRDNMNVSTRKCARCHEVKEISLFPKDRCEPSGYSYACKLCKAASRRARRAADPLAREKEREYERKTAAQTRTRKQAYYLANKEQILGRHYANRDMRLAQMSAYGKRNKLKINEYRRVYRANNREKFKAYTSNNRAMRRAVSGRHTGEDIRRQYAAQLGCCWWCKKKVGKKYHADHLIPISRGGSNGPENIVIACVDCNLQKGSKFPNEWIGRLL